MLDSNPMRRRGRLPIGVLVPAGLVALVGTLAVLQYRWLGQVSEAERDQLRTSLTQRARDFAEDFDHHIGEIYSAFQAIDVSQANTGAAPRIAEALDGWRARARFPGLIGGVYVLPAPEAPGQTNAPSLLEYREPGRALVAGPWPERLSTVRERLTRPIRSPALARGSSQVVTLGTFPVMSDVPAVVIPIHGDTTFSAPRGPAEPRGMASMFVALAEARGHLIVLLDRDTLRDVLVPAIAERHFPATGGERYRVAIVDQARQAILTRHLPAGVSLETSQADVVAPFFGLRLGSAREGAGGRMVTWNVTSGRAAGSAEALPRVHASEQVSVLVEQRTGAGDIAAPSFTSLPMAWTLLLQHADGSLDAAVANARRRNLWLSSSILTLLALSMGLIMLNARRSERLAAQQMDFVATVSHELRTPLTVIRSAAQNLSAGVVHDPAQARRYGDLIDAEGRRLTDMVEQVLEYAGLSGNRQLVRAAPLNVGEVVSEVMATCRPLLDAAQFDVEVAIDAALPHVIAEEDAVRRAINNLVTNAIKHASDGRWLQVTAIGAGTSSAPEVHVSVRDRGRGIEADDLPYVFEPFYRGKHALDRQTQGNGLGLSLVRRIAEAHGGRVTVTSAPGTGTTFLLQLPATTAEPARTRAETLDAVPQGAPDAPGHAR